MRWLSGWLLLCLLGAGLLGGARLSAQAAPEAQSAGNIVISEFRTRGPVNASDEFVELYNPTTNPVDMTNWVLRKSSGCGTTLTDLVTIGSISLLPGQYYLIANSPDYSGLVSPDQTYTTTVADNGGIALVDQSDVIIDQVGMCNVTAFIEGTNLAPMSGTSNQSYERKLGAADGNCIDLGDNSKDFIRHNGSAGNISNPQNSSSPQVSCGVPPAPLIEVLINEVAWAGTLASSDDEWIELYNPDQTNPIDISGWRLVGESGSVDVVFPANTVIQPDDYFLMERASSQVTNANEDYIYFGALPDAGDILRLRKPDGTVVDTANADGGSWPAGGLSSTGSMERMGVLADAPLSWVTNVNAASWTNTDAAGNFVHGTPGRQNWGVGVTHTPIPTSTFTPSPTSTTAPTSALTIVISEVAWAGTQSSSDDEWIELYNPGNKNVNLTNWNLRSSDNSPNIKAEFKDIVLGPGEYLLLERTDDDPTDVTGDVFYTGSLSNSGEILRLYDPNGFLVDTANSNGGLWPAGNASTFASMQRSVISTDSNFTWVTYDAARDTGTKALDASGNVIKGTPGRANVPFNVTATPTPRNTAIPGSGSGSSGGVTLPPVIGISEFLPRPGHDWNNDGVVDVFDEFIEIINAGRVDVNLSAYRLDDEQSTGSVPFTLPSITLKPDERAVFYASDTGILLSDAGDTVRLLRGNTVVDAYTYPVVRAPDQSWCRIPDRLGYWNDPCFPTPNNPNALTGTVPLPAKPGPGSLPKVCLLPDTTPDVFVYAECEAGGEGVWNRQFWDGADAAERLRLKEKGKGETIFE